MARVPAPPVPWRPAALFALAALAACWAGPGGPVYWDSFGYVAQSLWGRVGGLALGRPLFVLVAHGVATAWLHLGGSPWSLEPLLRHGVIAVSALSAPLTASLAGAAGLDDDERFAAGLAVALSPAALHTFDAVMTDGPSLTFALAACVAMTRPSRGAALLAGVLWGMATGLREQAVAQGLTLAMLLLATSRRDVWARGVCALGAWAVATALPVAWFATHQPGYAAQVRAWGAAMATERQQHPYGARDLAAAVGWLVAYGPVMLAAAAVAWRRDRARWWSPWRVAGAMVWPATVQLALLCFYQDISYSPRYLLSAVPGALAIPAGVVLARWLRGRWAWAAMVLPVLLAGPVLRARVAPFRAAVEALPAALRNVPSGSLVVTGQVCPAVVLTEALDAAGGSTKRYLRMCPGWGWPADPTARLDAALREGRVVVIDLRDAAWWGPRQREVRAPVERWAHAHAADVAAGRVVVW